VIFQTPRGKFGLYKALAANGSNFKHIRVQDAVPRDLVPKKKAMESVAADYRKAFVGTKTRVICRSGEVFLTIKKPDTTVFVKKDLKIAKRELTKDAEIDDDDDDDEYENAMEINDDDVPANPSKKRNRNK
jgi:hypothetical protein